MGANGGSSRKREREESGSDDASPSATAPAPALDTDSESSSTEREARSVEGTTKASTSSLSVRPGNECPYLDTISRQRLDFDFDKCCSVSLRKENVYACLVCGKYFQGRGRNTKAYTHALEETHFMFMNLKNGNVYCLPEGYQVKDRSLEDIKRVLDPRFTQKDVDDIDGESRWQRGLDGQHFLPGMVGLNNVKASDYANVVIHCLLRVKPFRNFFLTLDEHKLMDDPKVQVTPLLVKFGELCRKMWNSGNFKGHVSPLEFLLVVQERSKRRFSLDVQSDPVAFLTWLLNTLHVDLTKGKKGRKSIVTRCFQGEMKVTKIEEDGSEKQSNPASEIKFLMLALDLPPPPLFKDDLKENIIPQVRIDLLLSKYDGHTISESIKTGRSTYALTRLPKYLIFWAKRFTKNNFFKEKNPTIITFPMKNLQLQSQRFDLIATGCHEGKPDSGSYYSLLYHYPDKEWYQVEDLTVKEVRPEMVAISEAYFQIYCNSSELN